MEWKSFAALKHGQRQLPRLRDLAGIAALVGVEPAIVFAVALGDEGGAAAGPAPLIARLERVRHPVFTVDGEGVVHDVNDALCAVVERPRAEVVGRSLFDLVSAEATPHALTLVAALARGEAVANAELTLVRRDGATTLVELDAQPILDGSGRVVGAQAIGRDIGAERLFARQLNEQRHLLQTIFDRVPAACLVYDGAGIVVAANVLAARLFDGAAGDVVGRSHDELFGAPVAGSPVGRARHGGGVEQQLTLLAHRRGQRVYVHRIAGPLREPGSAERVVELLVDVSEQVRHGDLRLLSFWRGPHDGVRRAAPARERRGTARAEAAFDAELRWGDATERVLVENLSPGGLFIRTDLRIRKGTEIDLEWLLPTDRSPVRARAVVAWVRAAGRRRQAGVGVRFLQLGPAAA